MSGGDDDERGGGTMASSLFSTDCCDTCVSVTKKEHNNVRQSLSLSPLSINSHDAVSLHAWRRRQYCDAILLRHAL